MSNQFPVSVWATDEDVEFNEAFRARIYRALESAMDGGLND